MGKVALYYKLVKNSYLSEKGSICHTSHPAARLP